MEENWNENTYNSIGKRYDLILWCYLAELFSDQRIPAREQTI